MTKLLDRIWARKIRISWCAYCEGVPVSRWDRYCSPACCEADRDADRAIR